MRPADKITISKTILDYVMERREGVLTTDARGDQRWSPAASIVRGTLWLKPAAGHRQQAASLLDITGSVAAALRPGLNDVSRLSPGVYFVRREPGPQRDAPFVNRVVLTR